MRTMATVLVLGGLLAACADTPDLAGPGDPHRPSFNGSAPDPFDVSFVLDDACSFPVQAVVAGREKVILRPNGSLIVTAPGVHATVTNLDTGKSAAYVITGIIFVEFRDNGDAVIRLTGRNLVQDEAGLFITAGNWSQIIDVSGHYVQPLQGTGRKIDVCAEVS